jgi:hypothetical protein
MQLCQCNATAWFRNRYFEDLLVIDAAAKPYRVRTAELARPLRGWRSVLARSINQNLSVVLEMERDGEASVAAAKETAVEWIHREPEFWESSFALSEWERRVSSTSDMNGLTDLFG